MLDFCDLMCKYAETPKETAVDGAGSCRTFVALYCSMKKSLVHKNMPCRQRVMKGLDGTIKVNNPKKKGGKEEV